jgi:GntR family transcriptional regulator
MSLTQIVEAAGSRTLQRKVYDIIVRRMAQGEWRAGECLPSEHALAKELGVSQGTVRKVLDVLTAEKLLQRRQGKGTFIAENTQERTLFRFFRLAHPCGKRVTPEGGGETVKLRLAAPIEAEKLGLAKGEQVFEIARVRRVEGRLAIRELIVVPSRLFPNLQACDPLPNTLYSLYQTAYGINVTAAREELRADLADAEDARVLGVEEGSPMLCIDRVAVSLENLKVEYRTSRCASGDLVYRVTLT